MTPSDVDFSLISMGGAVGPDRLAARSPAPSGQAPLLRLAALGPLLFPVPHSEMLDAQVVHVAGPAGGDFDDGNCTAPAVHAAVAQDAAVVVSIAYHDLYTPIPLMVWSA